MVFVFLLKGLHISDLPEEVICYILHLIVAPTLDLRSLETFGMVRIYEGVYLLFSFLVSFLCYRFAEAFMQYVETVSYGGWLVKGTYPNQPAIACLPVCLFLFVSK